MTNYQIFNTIRVQLYATKHKQCGSSSPFPNSKSGAFVLVLCLKVEWLGGFLGGFF